MTDLPTPNCSVFAAASTALPSGRVESLESVARALETGASARSAAAMPTLILDQLRMRSEVMRRAPSVGGDYEGAITERPAARRHSERP